MSLIERLDFWVTMAILVFVILPRLIRNPAGFIMDWFVNPIMGRSTQAAKQRPQADAGTAAPRKAARAVAVPVRIGYDDDEAPTLAAPLPMVSLEKIAGGLTILIVGSRGSGKTVLLRALVGLKAAATAVFDPHNAPGKWPEGAAVIGGGSNYRAVYEGLRLLVGDMGKRSKAMNEGRATTFPRLLLAADEMGSIMHEAGSVVSKDEDLPETLVRRWLKESRKFGGEFIAGAHGDTAASLGSSGDTVAFKQSFDYIIYTGAFVRRALADAGHAKYLAQIPVGTTPEGNTFPLIVPVFRPTYGDWVLLDMRGCLNAPTLDRPALHIPVADAPTQAAKPAQAQRERPPVTAEELAEAMRAHRAEHGSMPSRAAMERRLYGYTGGAAHAGVAAVWDEAVALVEEG